MKNFFKSKSKFQILDMFMFIILALSSIVLSILDFIGILNLSLEKIMDLILLIMGFIVTSTLVERYFILDTIIQNMNNSILNSMISLSDRKSIEEDPQNSLEERFKDASEVYIVNHSNLTLMNADNISYIEDAVSKILSLNLLVLNLLVMLQKIY